MRRGRFAAPVVITFAVGCGHRAPRTAPEPAPSPIRYDQGTCWQDVADGKLIVDCPEELLPVATAEQLVYRSGEQCQVAPSAIRVRCPEGGPPLILPETRSISLSWSGVYLAEGTLICMERQDRLSGPGWHSNPPAPEVVDCPHELLPILAPGVAPDRAEDGRCWLREVEVACPR